MVIRIKEQTQSRLVIETWSSTTKERILSYFIPIALLLLALFVSFWLYYVASPIAIYCLGFSGVLIIGYLFVTFDNFRRTIKAKPMTTLIDVEAGRATVTADLQLEIPKWTTELVLDTVQSIELTWDDPRYDWVQLALRGFDGSYLLVSYGNRAELRTLAQQIQRMLGKPINDEEVR